MTTQRPNWRVLDTLYGEISFDPAVVELLRSPAVQRLRHVRLSNIDSLSMPGLAGLTRYEHALGTTHLASRLGFFKRLNRDDALTLLAAALLHDSALPPFGHLVEEAFQYVSAKYAHEEKWLRVHLGESLPNEVGGTNLQLMFGREAGLRSWAEKYFEVGAVDRLSTILETIRGRGTFGPLIASDLDLDNLDNLTRVGYHIGIHHERSLALDLASCIEDCNSEHGVIVSHQGLRFVEQWLKLRANVYEHLMLAREDFCGKLMLIYATVCAYRNGSFTDRDWILTDEDFLEKLTRSNVDATEETVKRWLLGDLWVLADMVWMQGDAPPYDRILEFSDEATRVTGRICFAYRIKDKRTRRVSIVSSDGARHEFGRPAGQWLLGVGSPAKKDFSVSDAKKLRGLATEMFATRIVSTVSAAATSTAPSFF